MEVSFHFQRFCLHHFIVRTDVMNEHYSDTSELTSHISNTLLSCPLFSLLHTNLLFVPLHIVLVSISVRSELTAILVR